jgi:tRNA 5-methylaminomethyl-2-thiouridine biosynthesis bifunctional protein
MNSDDKPLERHPDRAGVAFDEQGQPYSSQFDDVYFSRESGIDESCYVFLQHNQLAERWQALAGGSTFVIGETGFGTGLNFLVAWELWQRAAPRSATLHFVSVEKYPLSRIQLQQALALWPQLAHLAEPLIQAYPPMPGQDFHRLVFENGRVQLTLIFDDAVAGLQQLLPLTTPGPNTLVQKPSWDGEPLQLDAVFLDGFAPAKNPAMWSQPLFDTLARLSGPSTTFATFTAAAVARHGLKDAGFSVTKVPGFGRKRHMLWGQFSPELATPEPTPTTSDTRLAKPRGIESAWYLTAAIEKPGNPKELIIIGAGLAGCHTARALAERGFRVTVLERGTIASGASGNPQGVVYAKASNRDQPLTRFNVTALQFACRYYQTQTGYASCGAGCGVVHVAQSARQAEEYRLFAKAFANEPEFVQWLDQAGSEAECGVPLISGGLLFPQAGWLNPQALCRELLNHSSITCKEQRAVAQIAYADGQWQAFGASGEVHAEAPRLVIANARDALQLEQTAHLPLKAIRGQVTEAEESKTSQHLTHVLCGSGYIAPASKGVHCLGASFNLHETSPAPNEADDVQNLQQVADLSPALTDWPAVRSGRVSFRCTTPDYLPIVGLAPSAPDFLQRFAKLRRSAKTIVDDTGSFYPGLYVNVGHGSRGLTYAPLCAELLASLITAAPLPLSRNMVKYLHPARFLIRDLKRRRL